MIDIQRFNLSEFFGCVKATDTKEMKSNQLRSFRTQLQELSFAKWSDGQLRYVGAYKDGMDFESLSEDHLRYEMKGTMNMFQKNGRTKSVILKNFQSENKVDMLARKSGVESKKSVSGSSLDRKAVFGARDFHCPTSCPLSLYQRYLS